MNKEHLSHPEAIFSSRKKEVIPSKSFISEDQVNAIEEMRKAMRNKECPSSILIPKKGIEGQFVRALFSDRNLQVSEDDYHYIINGDLSNIKIKNKNKGPRWYINEVISPTDSLDINCEIEVNGDQTLSLYICNIDCAESYCNKK